MASAIGAALIFTILPPMAAKAMDIIKDKAKVNIEREISGLQTILCMIQGIVQVADLVDNIYIQNWLRDVVDIGYEARDVLDDFITFSSCIITAEEASNPVNFISSFIRSDTSNIPLAIINRLAKDIRRVRLRFDEKKNEGETFKTLISVVGGGSESVHEVGPFINKQGGNLFLGRKEVKEEIMKKLLHPSNDNRVHVVAIWGMGGIRKTTLAQSIYNDKKVRKLSAENRRWLCVGENKFSAEKVIREIVNDQNTISIERLQEKLVKKFRGKRFLIVLDDVWDVEESEWDLLFNPLTDIGKGGLIIITRRERELCAAISIHTAYNLKPLSEEDSWSIFQSYAYVNGKSDNTPDLKVIGKKIVKKLNGLPLALKVVGRSLLNKDSSTWTNFLESNQRKFRKNDGVMSALRKSYNHLPPHLKTCFTYCALFPKDHVLDKKALVEMWMAHDLIQKEEQERPEDVGAQYFEELVNASLFQCIDGKYVMHDLIHDLTLLVSNGEFASANSSLTNDQMKQVRHITIAEDDYLEILSLCNIQKLLTLYTIWGYDNYRNYSVLDDVFKQLKSIRVLVLCNEEIKKIPDSISELRHLRYIDVSKTKVQSLPDSLCRLYNLQMLAAPTYAVLPRDIVNIRSLRYVRAILPTCKGVGKLTSLQELSSINVCRGDNIRELGDMQRLRGKLTIRGLENVDKLEDDVGAFMEKQTLMDELVLKFDKKLEKSTISDEVLDAFGFPPNLTYLQISGYTGVKYPSWMVNGKHKFDKLQTLELFECPKLESLPPLGDAHLSSLRDLFIEYCPQLQSLPPDFHKLSSLNRLKIKSCRQLHLLPPDFHKLSSLNSLNIKSCPQLQSLPSDFHKLSSLNRLKIKSCPQLQSLPLDFHKLSSLNSLNIKSCPQLQLLPPNFLKLTSLKILSIKDCPQLESLPLDFHKLSSLNSFKIKSCPKLQSLPPDFHKLSSLNSLKIKSCPQLQSLPPHFHKLSSLETLSINRCPQLQSLPPEFHMLSSLKNLFIKDCPQLQLLIPYFKKFSSLDELHITSRPVMRNELHITAA